MEPLFDFIRKQTVFDAWDQGLHKPISPDNKYHLKTAQDLNVWLYLRHLKGKKIAEVGGGNSRILPALAKQNTCYNIEKFQGADGGPSHEVYIPGVQNIIAFLGENSPQVLPDFFDAVFSVSVVEHVPTPDALKAFFSEGVRSLKRGGIWLHAIDLYIEQTPDSYWRERFEIYREWVENEFLQPVGGIYRGSLRFDCSMATNPDNTMYMWNRVNPKLSDLRKRAQSVSIVLAARKR